MTKKFPTARDCLSGRFVTVETNKNPMKWGEGRTSMGKVGSYGVRRVDSGRFDSATRAANTVLQDSKKK